MAVRHARRSAATAARDALAELQPTSLPIDPRHLAALWQIPVVTKPIRETGIIGSLDYHGDGRFEIVISDAIDHAGCINFTIGHELGHCAIEGHAEHLFAPGRTRHLTGTDSDASDIYEIQANAFASELLMPTALCKSLVVDGDAADAGLRTVEHLARASGMSLTAAANRYVRLTDLPAAMIVSKGGSVEYAILSMELRDRLGKARSLHRGQDLPRHSPSATLARDGAAIARAETGKELDVAWQDWFGVACGRTLEQSKGLGRSGQVLTILTANDD